MTRMLYKMIRTGGVLGWWCDRANGVLYETRQRVWRTMRKGQHVYNVAREVGASDMGLCGIMNVHLVSELPLVSCLYGLVHNGTDGVGYHINEGQFHQVNMCEGA